MTLTKPKPQEVEVPKWPYGVIDIWAVALTPEMSRRSFQSHPELKTVIEWWGLQEQTKGMPPKDFVAMLDKWGVEAILMPSMKMASYRRKDWVMNYSVEEVYELTQQFPGRIYGLYGINPWQDLMEGLRELERAVSKLGFKGTHLHTYGFGLPINHRVYYPYYALCAELGVPAEMQVGHSAEIMPSAMAKPILLDDIAIDFPTLKLVGAHTGWPWVEELIAIAWKHPNVYIGTTMHAPRYWDPSLVNFMNTRGRDKVMFGTDYPGMTYATALPQIEQVSLREQAKENLLRKTAQRVFGVGKP